MLMLSPSPRQAMVAGYLSFLLLYAPRPATGPLSPIRLKVPAGSGSGSGSAPGPRTIILSPAPCCTACDRRAYTALLRGRDLVRQDTRHSQGTLWAFPKPKCQQEPFRACDSVLGTTSRCKVISDRLPEQRETPQGQSVRALAYPPETGRRRHARLNEPFSRLTYYQSWDRVASRGGRWKRAKRRGDARAILGSEDCRS